MTAEIIDGKALAAQIRRQVAAEVLAIKERHCSVRLAAILVGSSPAARVYADNQARTFALAGVDYQLHELAETITQTELDAILAQLAQDAAVTGIMVHLPLPAHLNTQQTQYHIDVLKDVEGVNPANIGHVLYGHPIIAPCTALAAVALIDTTGVPLQGAEVTVVGASRIAGRPTALLLTERGATVTVCHIHTRDLALHTRRAEILIVAAGKPGLIEKHHVRPGAVIIDIGINRVTSTDMEGKSVSKTVGDVDFTAVAEVASWITPVPGGVGPVTVAMLLKNTLRAARLVNGLDQPF
ncbi:MAG: bifunctional 5,10-methylenetetrahydrofolate dehydrogenase/5,10-methenyltetrahydrofolate cyclohydrolase [Planctomycetia bacterium]|jgi:methylenetetrahydrofolate dehydrogenase (NADP+)/methenyltetrahydrofolate cyclohydrolase|nr:bifunctional 5,10-methylenetetrahydrofolate dehydrogenase/5,10-methenyltetrahydrofolate cyclohydrolase [Planctomycetia bacterium]